jgi:hypothetical protein
MQMLKMLRTYETSNKPQSLLNAKNMLNPVTVSILGYSCNSMVLDRYFK